jgi:hypothetical protein
MREYFGSCLVFWTWFFVRTIMVFCYSSSDDFGFLCRFGFGVLDEGVGLWVCSWIEVKVECGGRDNALLHGDDTLRIIVHPHFCGCCMYFLITQECHSNHYGVAGLRACCEYTTVPRRLGLRLAGFGRPRAMGHLRHRTAKPWLQHHVQAGAAFVEHTTVILPQLRQHSPTVQVCTEISR